MRLARRGKRSRTAMFAVAAPVAAAVVDRISRMVGRRKPKSKYARALEKLKGLRRRFR